MHTSQHWEILGNPLLAALWVHSMKDKFYLQKISTFIHLSDDSTQLQMSHTESTMRLSAIWDFSCNTENFHFKIDTSDGRWDHKTWSPGPSSNSQEPHQTTKWDSCLDQEPHQILTSGLRNLARSWNTCWPQSLKNLTKSSRTSSDFTRSWYLCFMHCITPD